MNLATCMKYLISTLLLAKLTLMHIVECGVINQGMCMSTQFAWTYWPTQNVPTDSIICNEGKSQLTSYVTGVNYNVLHHM